MKISLENTKMLDEAKQSKGHFVLIEILIFAVVLVVDTILQGAAVFVPEMKFLFNNQEYIDVVNSFQAGEITQEQMSERVTEISGNLPDYLVILSLFLTVIATILCIVYCRFIEKRKLSSMGFRKNKFLLEYLVGALVGIGLFSLCVGICLVTGALRFDGVSKNINWLVLGMFFAGFLVQGMSEEVLCRGYFMVSMSRRIPVAAALIISSVMFAALHLANNGIAPLAFVNLVLFGVFAGVYILKRGNIWGACAMHSLWNFVQGNFYGISVSGMSKMETVLNMSSNSAKELLNGGDFGLEGGIAVTIVYTAAIVFMLFMKTNPAEVSIEKDV